MCDIMPHLFVCEDAIIHRVCLGVSYLSQTVFANYSHNKVTEQKTIHKLVKLFIDVSKTV